MAVRGVVLFQAKPHPGFVEREFQPHLQVGKTCHDNAVAESLFQLQKGKRIKRNIYPTREASRADAFNFIELFYNNKRRHSFNNPPSPVEYEKRFSKRLVSVWKIGGDSS